MANPAGPSAVCSNWFANRADFTTPPDCLTPAPGFLMKVKKILLLLFCGFFAVPCYCRQEASAFHAAALCHGGAKRPDAQFAGAWIEDDPCAEAPPAGLWTPTSDLWVKPDADSADGQSAQPSASGSQQPGRSRPHLIELSSANWQPLRSSEKFELFWRDLIHWETHASLAFDAGISAALADRQYLGTGAKGYFKTYGLNVADEADFTFFCAFLFPTVFHQDPRYIPRDHGSTGQRLAYALSRVVVTRADSGKSEFNASKVAGIVIATSVSSSYYSAFGADVGVGGTFASMGINFGSEAAFDLFKEFWPDVARKLKLNVWIRNIVRGSVRDAIRVS